jgi:hypothetical protein
MRSQVRHLDSAEVFFVGIDLHKVNWHVTIRTADVEVLSVSIPGDCQIVPEACSRRPTLVPSSRSAVVPVPQRHSTS